MSRAHVAILVVAACAFPWCMAICIVVACVRQLDYLRRRLSLPPPPRATRRIVVLIPSFNVNPDGLRHTLASCLSDPYVALVVIADGGSTDGTLQAAQKAAATNDRVTLVEAPRGLSGRANCLNLAAAVAADQRDGAASGDGDAVLLFLHSDTSLPEGFGLHVVDTMSDARVALGAFGIYTSGMRDGVYGLRGRLFSVLANTLNNWRSAWMETPYGDQALFCRRSTFEAVGGIPPLALMEDSAFVWEARRHGDVAIVRQCVRTAAGQWSALGPLFVMRNYLFLCAWVLGWVSEAWLHALYYAGRPLPLTPPYREIAELSRQAVAGSPYTAPPGRQPGRRSRSRSRSSARRPR